MSLSGGNGANSISFISGVEQWSARQAHILEAAGSNPAPATARNVADTGLPEGLEARIARDFESPVALAETLTSSGAWSHWPAPGRVSLKGECMAIRVMRYEIVGWNGQPTEAKKRWHKISDNCREMVNCMWQEWEAWHVEHGSHAIARQFADDLAAYRRKDRRDKPKLELQYMPSELGKHIYRVCADRFPSLHLRVQVLLAQLVKKRMTGKDVEGRWNVWMAVLLNRQGRPNCTGDQPIPFDKANCKIVEEDKCTRLTIRLTRLPQQGKAALSVEDHVTLRVKPGTNGAAVIRRIIDGDYKFCGSSIVYASAKRKWYALICYNPGESQKGELNDKETAYLVPCRETPWMLWHRGRYHWLGGRGRHVEAARRRLLTGRWSRQEGYRYGGSSNKGHGRKRAIRGVMKLSRAWKDFTKTYNHQVTHDAIAFCVQRGIGRLVYLQPASESKRTNRFLATAGKLNRNDSTAWDWAQVGKMLAYKGMDVGVHVDIRKCTATGRFREPSKRTHKTAL